MQNLTVNTHTIGTTAVLIFSGTGKVHLQASGSVSYGTDNTVTFANPNLTSFPPVAVMEYLAPVEIWAISNGAGGGSVTVKNWY